MGTVFKAYDTRLETEVALKVIRTDNLPPVMHDTMLKRFDREAKSLARLKHPNIVLISDYGEHEGTPYLVMPFLPGGTLKDRLKQGPIPWRDAIRLLRPIIFALEFAHGEKIVHRDLKPANILLTETRQPMLADFGIAKILEGSGEGTLTGEGVGIGTPEYMAPEQWTGDATILSDVYSLGVVLYEMLAGHKPYVADTPAAIYLKQISEPLPRLTTILSDAPNELEVILQKALAKQPSERYQSMQEFGKALDGLHNATGRAFPNRGTVQSNQVLEADTLNKTTAVKDGLKDFEAVPHEQPKKRFWILITALILIAVFIAGGLILARQGAFFAQSTATATITETHVVATPMLATPTVTPNPYDIGSTVTGRDSATLVYVPEGEFMMGSDNNIYPEEPVHAVYLDAYWIDQTEVTNGMYRQCTLAGECAAPYSFNMDFKDGGYYGFPQFNNYPVVFVNWDQANSYCQWAGRRLPTEAEWEKAARGTDERLYPWGNQTPNQSLANYVYNINAATLPGTTQVGTYHPAGDSPYGAYDMAGNVEEWVSDWFSYTYYSESPYKNPTGPASGDDLRSTRGGSWRGDEWSIFSYTRPYTNPDDSTTNIGFRCAVSAENFAQESVNTVQTLETSIQGKDGAQLVEVPAGEFMMGGINDAFYPYFEVPIHSVYLDQYWIDQVEVTNIMYHRCVAAGVCMPPEDVKIIRRSSPNYKGSYYYGLPGYDNFPVVNVNWGQANTYCQWADRRLPTEAEWEKAARGVDNRIYPWGNEVTDYNLLNYDYNFDFPSPGGLYTPHGDVSYYGVYDMAGNVTEYVSDWYSDIYLPELPYENPTGPSDGEYKVTKGNSWSSYDAYPMFFRGNGSLDSGYQSIGFRCATSDASSIQHNTSETEPILEEDKSVYFVDYSVIHGETCENLAAAHGISMEDIMALNPELNASCSLASGDVVLIQAPYTSQEDFTSQCEDKMAFIDDVNIPDGTIFTPGQSFTKTWRVQNIGSCTWTSRYALANSSYNYYKKYPSAVDEYTGLQGPIVVFGLFDQVKPGESVNISVTLTTPSQPGTYYEYWDLYNTAGEHYIGESLQIRIEVK